MWESQIAGQIFTADDVAKKTMRGAPKVQQGLAGCGRLLVEWDPLLVTIYVQIEIGGNILQYRGAKIDVDALLEYCRR